MLETILAVLLVVGLMAVAMMLTRLAFHGLESLTGRKYKLGFILMINGVFNLMVFAIFTNYVGG